MKNPTMRSNSNFGKAQAAAATAAPAASKRMMPEGGPMLPPQGPMPSQGTPRVAVIKRS